MNDTQTLLVWEQVPEQVTLYILPNSTLDEADHAILALADGCYINSGDYTSEEEDALAHINDALCENDAHVSEERRGTRWSGRWALNRRDSPLIEARITHVYKSGFIL